MTVHDTKRLADTVSRKLSCLTRLRQLGQQQDQLIADDEIGQLMRVLAAKQRHLDELQAIERELDPFRNEPPESRAWVSQEHRRRCADDLRRCETLLTEIMEREKRSESLMRSRRDAASKRLEGFQDRGEAQSAYTAAGQAPCSSFDTSSDVGGTA